MSAELVLASLATADLAIKYGKVLLDLYKCFIGAEELDDRILCIEFICISNYKQVTFLKKIWGSLDEEHQNLQGRIMQKLVAKLEDAINQIESVLKKKDHDDGNTIIGVKKWKYVFWAKESMDKTIQELQEWQRMFDPSWYLIMKIADPVIDEELARDDEGEKTKYGSLRHGFITTAKGVRDSLRTETHSQPSIFLPDIRFASSHKTPISYCTAEIFIRPNGKTYLLDSVACLPGVDTDILNKDVRDLARKLSGTDPLTFGLLRCRGVIKVFDETKIPKKLLSYDFVFYIPEGLRNPRSLRSVLITAGKEISLSARFRVAQQLAQSVSYVHTYGFVHKNVRPDTVLVFEDYTNGSTQSASFLLGFEKFRPAEGRTIRAGDSAWEKDLYRHPRRQGLKPEDAYLMQHDIYSLGVCLLEIGLWETFVTYPFGEGLGSASPSPLLAVLNEPEDDIVNKASLVKDALVQLSKKKLPACMGDKYTNIVVSCLTCLDESSLDFGDDSEFKDEDGVLIGVRYISKILLQLNQISI
ncbi:uncharacterized protein BDR25DRAFT_298344 [Lindgomyces ingoldianus]|uniref:Uncharacterized protein n=1 Tax=Lindgomyces ingoldianus TaxID=673940 RepID=A0ACB6QA90_9PLEO|nr:uncharacterized protein BDR25DRAFT_298344 [Lindgomyces ingoldianus]KAF2463302.1 hypothetical protein BDR25DRAFT_298344 [Lindgomyces ingoldianus]